ncbi:MAG: bifunctional homocysteine S-methyltransferase/methylenetetrahydrofolate reductase [Ruminococcaceae bacterium]|nr:bifunctional homocysteine S-methyltransferase/methylenetetrahydrofolate reductase [Oscillospiraceae bacterium]
MNDIRAYLKQGRPLLFDGAMGTLFASRPGCAEGRCEQADLECPEEILNIHKAYLEAGCRAIKTNTFSVGVEVAEGREQEAQQIIEAACRLAKEAAEPYDAWVFADLGPAPQGTRLTPAELYCRQAELFLEQGVTHFLVETLPTDAGIAELAAHLKQRCPEAYLIVSFAVGADGVTREGLSGKELFRRTAALAGVDAVGFNCVSGPHHLLEYIQTLDLTGVTLSVMPNAGYPTVLGRRTVFGGSAEYFGEKLAQIARSGAAIVGGCCGTTPEHIACAAAALKDGAALQPQQRQEKPRTWDRQPGRNTLAEKLDAGKRVIAVELDPPADDDIGFFMEGVQALQQAGADAITIADCPVGRPRADSSLLACKVKRELGIEALPHMTCRDRNLNATKALLLGLSIEGVHNVLLVTGDPIPTEHRDAVKTVFNFNSRKLARYVSDLNGQLSSPFRIFGALNLNAKNFAMQLKIAKEKEENGVTGFLTQPVLSAEALENLKLARQELRGKILGGIFPVVSHRNACFLNNEISGMRVCDEIVALYEGKERAEAEELAVSISAAIAREIEPYVDGYYLMTPFKRVELMTRILHEIR